jgi:hypothetical protein
MANLFLGQAKSAVDIVQLAASCPKFKDLKLLPYRIQSVVGEEAFRVFVSALGGTEPALTTKNVNDQRLLCEEFEFAALRSKVSTFEMRASAVDDKVRTGRRDVRESTLQVTRSVCLLEQGIVELRATNSRLSARNRAQKKEKHKTGTKKAQEKSVLASPVKMVPPLAPRTQFLFPSGPPPNLWGFRELPAGSQPMKADFARCSGVFRLRRGS